MSLRALALVSFVYDLALALPLLFFATGLARLLGLPVPVPPIHAELNGLFTLTLAVGYLWAAGDVVTRRGYFWVAGVLTKGLGAVLFVVDHVVHASPALFLVFSLSDGTLAVLTLVLLLRSREGAGA